MYMECICSMVSGFCWGRGGVRKYGVGYGIDMWRIESMDSRACWLRKNILLFHDESLQVRFRTGRCVIVV